jgi:hypothetical protein
MRSTQARPTPAGPAIPNLWSRLLDGAHPWGSFDATVGRYGVRRYRLIIYPAGTTTAERRLARVWRGWPAAGAVLVLLAVMVFGRVASSPIAVSEFALTAYVTVGAILFLLGGPARVHVRSMLLVLLPHTANAPELSRYTEWQALVQMLIRADHLLAKGAISSGERDAIWREAYDRLEGNEHV